MLTRRAVLSASQHIPRLPLSQTHPRLHRLHRLQNGRTLNKPRTFVSSSIQGLCEGFLDLAIALPFPESIPPYSGTIILVTVLSRLVFTVPFSVWAKRRQWRAEDLAMPELAKERPAIIQQVLKDMKKDGFHGDKEEAQKELASRAKPAITARRDELFKKYSCSPKITMIIPPVTQLPLFVAFSMVLSRVSSASSVFDSESFFTLTSLSHADPTVTLPIVLGILSLANVESSRWFITPEALEREKKVAEWNAKKRAGGHTVLEPKKIVQSSLRILSVGRILIAALVPGSIQLYWVTSAAFGLVQSWVLDWLELRRRRAKKLQALEAEPVEPEPPKSTIVFTQASGPKGKRPTQQR